MELNKLLTGIENFKVKGNIELNIEKVECNSKKVTPNSLFVAIKGYDFDGHEYIDEAIENGATAIMLDMSADLKKINLKKPVTVIIAEDTRKALATISCNFFGNPSNNFKLIGVTGTKGKTTTTYMIKSILEQAGYKVGLIGTIANFIGDECLGFSNRTTPESLELQELFYKMSRAKVDYVVMEVSSQSLKLNRVMGCKFDYAIFTNLYKDHISLKEHADMNEYFESKLKLFQMCPRGFVNADDFKCNKIIKGAPNCNINTYSVDNKSDLIAKDITITNISVDFKVKMDTKNERIKVNIPGRYSVYNALAAISLARALGIDAEKIKEGLANIVVPGRNELVPNKDEYAIMIEQKV
jgi:UDP-N-acetylmuramoyl-L-alanyl-D-glutamate--2,6-diaminopimelate ligase